ncbi:MAG: aminoacyl-tRNA hydrolase [Chloroflexota bacterium]|nr:aminoacyl-tRNA hydrolase [Chloroflexota bacterium]
MNLKEKQDILVVIGLGNPGDTYANTRHNVGFRCINTLARKHGIPLTQRHKLANYGEGSIEGQTIILVKPKTYMNLSGKAISYILARHNLTPDRLLVVYDDMDLPIRRVRLRPRGGPAGHNGIKSIISELNTEDFARLRIGIGKPVDQNTIDFVLSAFSNEESQIMDDVMAWAVEAVEWTIRHGIESAMGNFNQRLTAANDET